MRGHLRWMVALATFLAVATAAAMFSHGNDVSDFHSHVWREHLPELIVCVGFSVAGFVQGVSGFASGMVAMAILPLALPMIDVVPVVAIFCAATNLSILIQLRHSVDEEVMSALPMLIFGQFGGVPLGVMLLQHADPEWLRVLLGFTMLGFVAHECHDRLDLSQCRMAATAAIACRDDDENEEASSASTIAALDETPLLEPSVDIESPKKGDSGQSSADNPIPSWLGLPFGLLAGILNGALNEGGPPVVVYFALRRWNKDKVKVALQAFFVSMSVVTILTQMAHGIIHPHHLYFDLVGFPAAVFGIGSGTMVYERIDTKRFANVITALLLVTGLLYIYSASSELAEKHGSLVEAMHVVVNQVGNTSSTILTRSVGDTER